MQRQMAEADTVQVSSEGSRERKKENGEKPAGERKSPPIEGEAAAGKEIAEKMAEADTVQVSSE